jgi:hypothetical protein
MIRPMSGLAALAEKWVQEFANIKPNNLSKIA